jgi:regulator of protease activity HflC (stomatin/prohibitin superfamily)
MEIFWIIIAILVVIFFLTFFTVKQQTINIIERFGKFSRTALPGLNFKVPFVENVSGILSLRIQKLDVSVETKTLDNVFIKILVSVQYHVLEEKVYYAFYKLSRPEEQIRDYVFDVVRAKVPQIKLDDVFEKKDDIANAVKDQLKRDMDDYGYGIKKALVTDIDPDAKVKASMNEINAAQRMRIAATEKGEADKILKVKAAEADAESKALSGVGIANQRKAIIEGLKSSVEDFQKTIPGANAQDVMNLVMMTQYFDTLKDIGSTANSNTILMPHTPGGMTSLIEQFRDVLVSTNEINKRST